MLTWCAAALGCASLALLVAGPPVPRVALSVRPTGWLRRRDRSARATGERIHEVCEVLASELAAGRPTLPALQLAAEHWDGLAPVVRAHRVGVGVDDALRAASREPGARDLRLLAAAWQVSERTGHGLADAVRRVARGIEARQRSRRVVDSELASARATARLVACLPLVAIGMGAGSGADPVGFLLTSPLGWLAGLVGLALLALGLGWIEAIARGASG